MYGDPYRYRRPYRPVYGGTVIYGVPVYAGPGYYPNFGYSDPGYYDDSAYAEPPADYAAPGDSAVAAPPAEAPPIEQAEAAPMPAYRPPYVKPQAELGPPAEPATTLVYKDGRPSEQIHNYMISSTTLYVLDDHRREIPLDEIDLPATEKINHEAGVDFQPPNFVR